MHGRIIQRGDIVIADLLTTGGSIQHGRRPILIVSNNTVTHILSYITYQPLKSKQRLQSHHVKILQTQYNLKI